jgi:hypothetical protein
MTAHNIDSNSIKLSAVNASGYSGEITSENVFHLFPETGSVTFEVPGLGEGRAFNYTEQYPEPPTGCVQFNGGQILCGEAPFGSQEDVLSAIVSAAKKLH